ncbi:hypothetical protein M0R19_01740 [Candidatus Pacearchaeota archaeon]|nr:hypothetical protein [Candidatus Pacearchaeota archaeon]
MGKGLTRLIASVIFLGILNPFNFWSDSKKNKYSILDEKYKCMFFTADDKGITIGYDTNGDKKEDSRYYYNVTGKDKNGFYIMKKYKAIWDRNEDGLCTEDEFGKNTENKEMVNEAYDLMFLTRRNKKILTEGFDTNEDQIEDLRYAYEEVGKDSNGIYSYLLKAIAIDMNNNHTFDPGETTLIE